ncbi:hypothetical protein NOJ28_15670 [Neorhizobium galegae]|uniref:hypothetical protein n=1 Tax=Neorhizobium galegae TaxID=399 RepID=UPI002103F558|nr:hypothetical protein [Neorhizobium galegae]MCQ1766976.1 hypothetical protein [Neorhizobium galegae]MCQ1849057.1 hypothetical protein [Neorhizobium galegae]
MTRGTIQRRPEARQPTTAALPAQTDRARRDGTSIESELFHRGQIDEAAYYGGMAPYLRLPFIAAIDPGSVADIPGLDSQLHRPNQIRINHLHKAPQVAVVPEAARLAELKAALLAMPLLGQDLAITAPSATRQAVWRSGATRRVRETINGLFDGSAPVLGPHCSHAPRALTPVSDWPPSLLDIKLICEADDQDTIAALTSCFHHSKLPLPPRLFTRIGLPSYLLRPGEAAATNGWARL